MRWRWTCIGRGAGLALAVLLVAALGAGGPARAAAAGSTAAPGWLETVILRVELELADDVAALADIPAALDREWRSFDTKGSALGALGDLGLVVVVTLIGLVAERGTARLLGRRLRARMRGRGSGPTLLGLLGLVACDLDRKSVV